MDQKYALLLRPLTNTETEKLLALGKECYIVAQAIFAFANALRYHIKSPKCDDIVRCMLCEAQRARVSRGWWLDVPMLCANVIGHVVKCRLTGVGSSAYSNRIKGMQGGQGGPLLWPSWSCAWLSSVYSILEVICGGCFG